MKLTVTTATLCVTAIVLAGCGGGSGSTSKPSGDGQVVDGGTFTMSLTTDPGSLDPVASAQGALFQISEFAYDRLLSVNPKTGAVESELATKWQVAGDKITLTLHDGITCSDGSKLTASVVADSLNYVGDPKNQSPFLGVYFPVGAKATGNDQTGTVQITLASPGPFVLNGLADLPIVCRAGLDNRALLKDKTEGTGPYELTAAVPGDHYDFKIRPGYTWGPNGATSKTPGLPDTIVVKIVPNETTAANLLLSGGLNEALVSGPDAQRLEGAGLFSAETTALLGEQWYNHASGHPTSDPAVRMALTRGIDLAQLEKILTSGHGAPATTLATADPTACPGNSVSGALPTYDVAAANKLLDDAGWTKGSSGTRSKNGQPLTIRFIYDTAIGAGVASAAELAVQQWQQLGIKVTSQGQTGTAINDTLFSTGNWDVVWEPLNVNSPDQLVPFFSGAVPPNGTNFSGIANAVYEAGVKKASAIQGVQGCADWLKAEADLIKDADIVPFANSVPKLFGKKAEFVVAGVLIPTSIRMLAS